DEVEAQWSWIDRIRAAWSEKGITPRSYAAGTWGPSAAIALTERDGISSHEGGQRAPILHEYRERTRSGRRSAPECGSTDRMSEQSRLCRARKLKAPGPG